MFGWLGGVWLHIVTVLQYLSQPNVGALRRPSSFFHLHFFAAPSKSTLKTEEEVFQRVGQHDVAERMRAKGIVQKQVC